MARKVRIDMTGQRYGRLVGVAFAERDASGHAQWLFACDCGHEVVALGKNVRAGTTRSCGCLHREISAARLTRHGHRAAGRHGPTYRAWQEINTWCRNPHAPRFAAIGGHGIAVCERWREFDRFVADMGERPASSVLARIDAAENFTPANCRWTATAAPRRRAAAEIAAPLRSARRQPAAGLSAATSQS